MSRAHFHCHTTPAAEGEPKPEALALARILAALGGRVEAVRVSLFERCLDEGSPAFRLKADWHADETSSGGGALPSERLPVEELTPYLAALQGNEPVLAGSAGGGPWSRLYLPLGAAGQLRGLLRVDRNRAWEAPEVTLLQGAGTVLAVAVEPAPSSPAGGPRMPGRFLTGETPRDESGFLEERALRSQRLEILGKLAGGLAHDLNNMLTPIRLGIDLLQEDPKAEERVRLLAAVRGSIDQGATMVQQILTFARGAGPVRHEPLRIESLLGRVEQVLRYTFPKSIVVERVVASHLWTVRGDATQLFQMVVNLCVNARDAMPEGGTLQLLACNVMLRKDGPQPHPEIRPGPYVLMQVSDTGCGMDGEIQARIFEPFFTTKDVGRGTGLGLSTALAIAHSHSAHLGVESAPGRGSRFTLYLPVTDSEPLPELEARGELPPGRGELILLVDDEDSIRDVVRATLETFGYRVLCATNGEEALECYGRCREEIAVVLVDLQMPIMDGLTTIRHLLAINPEVRILAVSGTLPPTVVLTEELQRVAFLHKPYRARRLLEALRTVLDSPA